MDFTTVKKDLLHVHHKLAAKGYVQATGGNCSARVPDATDLFAIKRTSVNMEAMTLDDILIVDGAGRLVEGEGTPSKEVNFHLGIMALRPEVNAVVHAHPSHAIAFANSLMDLPLVTVTARKVLQGRVPSVGSAPAGSLELRDLVVGGFRDNPDVRAVLMQEHGVCAVGDSPMHAYNAVDLIEATALQAILTHYVAAHRTELGRLR